MSNATQSSAHNLLKRARLKGSELLTAINLPISNTIRCQVTWAIIFHVVVIGTIFFIEASDGIENQSVTSAATQLPIKGFLILILICSGPWFRSREHKLMIIMEV